jgi:protein-S-isoprenylcysteine O-methyltransferase Ste14
VRPLGLAILAVAMCVTIVADRYLVHHFRVPGVLAARSVLTEGPYRYIRHPRTAGILLAKLATPLALGSGLGLFALIPAVLFFPLYIQLEEEHLLRVFGDTYRFYRTGTKRILPFVY